MMENDNDSNVIATSPKETGTSLDLPESAEVATAPIGGFDERVLREQIALLSDVEEPFFSPKKDKKVQKVPKLRPIPVNLRSLKRKVCVF